MGFIQPAATKYEGSGKRNNDTSDDNNCVPGAAERVGITNQSVAAIRLDTLRGAGKGTPTALMLRIVFGTIANSYLYTEQPR